MDHHQRLAGALLATAALLGAPLLLLLAAPLLPLLMAPSEGLVLWVQVAIGALLLLLLLTLITGIQAARGRPGARRWIPRVALPMLLCVPLGTAIGIYALWSCWRQAAPRPLPEWQLIARRAAGRI